MATLKDKFIDGCIANGVDAGAGPAALGRQSSAASDYSFNKSHAACYALVAYHTAWLKANHPAEYMAALISSVMSTKDRVPYYVSECAEMGIEVLPPDVNSSMSDFAVVEGRIRFGLSAVKSVGEGAVRAIIAAREDGPFTSIWEFCERVDGRRAQPAHAGEPGRLRRARLDRRHAPGDDRGAGAGAGLRPEAAGRRADGPHVDLRPRRRRGRRRRRAAVSRSHPAVPEGEWDKADLLKREKETLGLYVTSHPLADVKDQLARRADVQLASFSGLRDGQVVTVGGLVTSMRTLVTKKGDQMAFVELDDTTATIEVIVFANALAAVRSVLHPDAVVMVKGRVDRKSEGEVKLVAFELAPFEATADFGVVKLRVDARHAAPTVIHELRSLIGEHPGDAPVMLELETSEGSKTLRFGPGFRVQPDGNFFAEAKALLGDAALIA